MSSVPPPLLPSSLRPESPVSLILDIETLGRKPSAIITEIGVVAFRRSNFEEVDCLDLKLDIFAQMVVERTFDPDTIRFHQTKESLPHFTATDDPQATMTRLHHFYLVHRPHRIWMQGPDFDRPILESFFTDFHRPLPWPYHQASDARSMWKAAFGEERHPSRPHHALPDARATLANLKSSLLALNRPEAA